MMKADPADVVSIILNEDNASGQSGWAALRAKGDQTEVVLSLPSGDLETEKVHIHSGSCGADTLGGVKHGLTSFIDGSGFSVTTVDVPLRMMDTTSPGSASIMTLVGASSDKNNSCSGNQADSNRNNSS